MNAPIIVTRCCDCELGCAVAGEWYMVRDTVWELAWCGERNRRKSWQYLPGQDVLCIGCLEKRIGRTLCADDFTDVPINDPTKGNASERLVATGAQLLGVYAGAWEGEPSASLASDRNWGPDKRIPAGMGIVVPGERILEVVMNDPELKRYRAEIHQKRRAKCDT